MRLLPLACALGLALLVACGGSDDTGSDGKGLGGSGGGGGIATCDDPQTFRCTTSCDGGTLSDPVCALGKWGCPVPLTATSVCSARCPGVAAPGDRCGDEGWVCEADESDLAGCPARLCSSCTGFDGTLSDGFCICACSEEDEVICWPDDVGPA
ncbi:hypothetical protein [Vulgatibacter sp.]|uniref:hypothetical protein n=1 Tax=Vulgatibacter sp. TaxID=1971226 RepID=UPI003562C4FA